MSHREDLIKLGTARVASIDLDPGEQSPWHLHSELVETVFCLQGAIEVQIEMPGTRTSLLPGERLVIAPLLKHRLVNRQSVVSTYLLVQSGRYDFIEDKL